ncbi:T9SS type A sorting domain-containing protein [uncultured Aquimarina sp.]|uniref:T9SS type A sorting domain-containing protein n=1 Tax=uncultured Aquimarina sp. TaxID=575652 RepID=UPI0026095BCA|nr:T9SS type A sorting domain-containing protein [uncultured Aquimarina sp.]
MKKIEKLLFVLLLHLSFINVVAQTETRVLSPRNDIPKSNEYEVSIANSINGSYKKAHVHFTKENWKGSNDAFGYNRYLAGYRMSYVNFEFKGGAAWAMIKMPNKNVPNLEVRPKAKQAEVFYEIDENGFRIAKIKIHAPTNDYFKAPYLSVVPLVNDEQKLDNALGLFANPFTDIPSNNVVNVEPGEVIPRPANITAGQTVVFKPGTHNIGEDYPLKSGVNYYFSNGSYVKGNFLKDGVYNDVRMYGYGIVSTAHLKRYDNNGERFKHPIIRFKANNVTVEGITFEDPSHHTCILGPGENGRNVIKKIKIIGWRANSDGPHVTGKALVQDCFIRVQDDASYIASYMDGVTQERLTTWNDFNGTSFLFSYYGGGKNAVTRNCDVIYARTRFNKDDPGGANNNGWKDYHSGVISLSGLYENQVIENITLEDIRIDDEKADREIFHLVIGQNPFRPADTPNNNTRFRNITFRNITAAGTGGYPNRIEGWNDIVVPEGVIFDCINIAGEELKNFDGWRMKNIKLNEITFKSCSNEMEDDLSSITASANLQSGQSYEVKLDYIASEDRNIGIRLQDDKVTPVVNYGLTTIAITEGSSTATATVTVDSSIPQNVGELRWFAFMVPKGGTWDDRLDTIEQTGVTVATDNPDGDTDNITSNYWRLENKATGQWVQPKDCASASGTRLIIVPTANTGDCTMFQFQETVNDHYFIINKATNGRLKFQSDSNLADDSIPVILVGSEFTGPHPQWQLIDAGDGYHRIQNRVTGNWIRSQACAADENTLITQVSKAFTGDCTKWKLVNAGTIDASLRATDVVTGNTNITVYPNPTRDQLFVSGDTKDMVSINIYDLQGRSIITIDTKKLSGQSTVNINTTGLQQGLYVLWIDYLKKDSKSIQFVISN